MNWESNEYPGFLQTALPRVKQVLCLANHFVLTVPVCVLNPLWMCSGGLLANTDSSLPLPKCNELYQRFDFRDGELLGIGWHRTDALHERGSNAMSVRSELIKIRANHTFGTGSLEAVADTARWIGCLYKQAPS